MKILLNKYKKYFIWFLFPYLFLVLSLVVPTNQQAITLGSYYEVGEKSVTDDSRFYALYVRSWYRITAFQNMVAKNHELIDFYETSTSVTDLSAQGKISKESSLNQSYLASYTFAKLNNPSLSIEYNLDHLKLYNPLGNLKVGSKITIIDDLHLNSNSYFTVYNYIYEKARLNENITITVNDDLENVNARDLFYANFYPYFDIKDYNIDSFQSNSGGPSAGLIYTLKMYTSLLGTNLGNLKIAGTGTIEFYDEDTILVGKIGGLKQKIAGLKNQNIDILFIPLSNKSVEIEQLIAKYIPNTFVYFVSSLEEAVGYLYENI